VFRGLGNSHKIADLLEGPLAIVAPHVIRNILKIRG
jgi:hypothetical protein